MTIGNAGAGGGVIVGEGLQIRGDFQDFKLEGVYEFVLATFQVHVTSCKTLRYIKNSHSNYYWKQNTAYDYILMG